MENENETEEQEPRGKLGISDDWQEPNIWD